MSKKTSSCFFFLASLFISTFSQAAVLVNPPSVYPQHTMGNSGYYIYYGGSSSGSPYNSANYNGSLGYRFINTASTGTDGLIYLDVSSNETFTLTTGQQVVAWLSSTAGGAAVPLVGASVVSDSSAPSACTSDSCVISSSYATYATKGSVLRISFTLTAFCNTIGSGNLCSSSSPATISGKTLSQSVYVNFGIYNGSTVDTSSAKNVTFYLGITDIPPVVGCPSSSYASFPEKYYFPGDKSIYFSDSSYSYGVGTGFSASDAGVSVSNLTVLSQTGTSASHISLGTNAIPTGVIGGYVAIGGGTQVIDGFTNASGKDDSANTYHATLYAQNIAGIFSDISTGASGTNWCDFANIQAQPVSGLLTESKCFIATAAYHDGRAAPVMMLRKFRDEILTQTFWGRKFIETYYTYSPALAEWAWDKPLIRSLALRALAPIELVAWTILKFSNAEEVSASPYIDKINSQLDQTSPRPQVGDSYIESVKKTLEPSATPSSESYTESEKKKLKSEEPSQGYSAKEKAKLPKEKYKESPIKLVKEKRDRYPKPDYEDITTAVSFKMGITPGMVVTNSSGSARASFTNIYGGGWQPDVLFHFERQLFHSENLGSFALGIDTGMSYGEGFGQLAFAFGSTGTTVSKTKFSFIQVPLMADAYYRFNLLRIIRPYIGVGAGTMLYTEIRKDKQHDKRGYSFIYEGSVGAALLLDFLDSATADESYLSNKVQHSYLFAEYNMLNTLSKSGLVFERGGIYSGFMFEY